MKLSPSSLVRIIVSLIVIASLASVRAAEWTGAPNVTSGTATLWNTADNWDPSGVPGVEDDADCQMTGDDYTINYFSPMSAASVGRVLVDNDEEHTTTLNINADRFKSRASNSRSIVGPNGSVVVGAGGNARFEYYYVSGSWLYLYTDGDFTVDGGDAEFYPHTALAIRSGSTVSVKNGSLVTWTDKNIENIRVSGGILNIEGGTVTLGDGGIKLGEYSDDLGGGGADGV
ncbi:MAG: hypothetical protein K9N51_12865, partial [Candidatus Pacebacteria bacterium]|nr:hypothetical protein [Candidatus Paceibacterota bacterium]